MTNRIPYCRIACLSDTKRLRAQHDVLDRTSTNLANVLKNEDLKMFLEKLKQETLAKQIKTNTEMKEISNCLKTLGKKSLVLDLDMDNLRDFLFKITDDITSLKDTSKESLELLADREKNYLADLDGLEKRVDEMRVSVGYAKRGKSLPWIRTKSTRSETVIPQKAHPETDAFDKFLLRTGGHTGGWDEADHLLFLRHSGKHKGARLADAVHAVLPDIPPEVIQEHETWYSQYKALKAEQKAAIALWREEQKKAATEARVELPPSPIKSAQTRLSTPSSAEAVEKKKQIMQWKLKREQQRALEASRRRSDELQHAEARRQKSEQDLEQRRAVQAYQQRKRAEEAAERAKRHEQDERGRVTDSRLIRMFRERDRETVAAALKRIEKENVDRAERANVRHTPMLRAKRDPSRLLLPTEVWRHRLLQRQEDSSREVMESRSMHLDNLPRLKVPSWRKLAA